MIRIGVSGFFGTGPLAHFDSPGQRAVKWL